MTFMNLAFLLFVTAGSAGLMAKAWGDYRDILKHRSRMLDDAAQLFAEPAITIEPDGYPALTGILPDGRRARIEIVADTLVPRRLPQLWLKVSIYEHRARARPSIGVLARPTGAEFYSLVQGLPDWIAPPVATEFPLLIRGRGAGAEDVGRIGTAIGNLFVDTDLKEAAITPHGIRIVRRIAQGDRGAHILYRQIRFPVQVVEPSLAREAIRDAELLEMAFEAVSRPLLPEAA